MVLDEAYESSPILDHVNMFQTFSVTSVSLDMFPKSLSHSFWCPVCEVLLELVPTFFFLKFLLFGENFMFFADIPLHLIFRCCSKILFPFEFL